MTDRERMEVFDDDLKQFEVSGAAPLPSPDTQGYAENNGARIWYASYGSGFPVILLHGGLGHSGNWGYQLPDLTGAGYRGILVDSRGHGRSSRDGQPYSYELMASDVLAVMDVLHIDRAALIGWSDGACTSLVVAGKAPTRIAGVLFFACNMDPSGVKEIVFEADSALGRCFARHTIDYAQLSTTPDQLKAFVDAVSLMQKTQPNYSVDDLAEISVPVTVVQSENDEFIKREHATYLAKTIPHAELVMLDGVSHFAPVQRPQKFNTAMLAFLRKIRSSTLSSGVSTSPAMNMQ